MNLVIGAQMYVKFQAMDFPLVKVELQREKPLRSEEGS